MGASKKTKIIFIVIIVIALAVGENYLYGLYLTAPHSVQPQSFQSNFQSYLSSVSKIPQINTTMPKGIPHMP